MGDDYGTDAYDRDDYGDEDAAYVKAYEDAPVMTKKVTYSDAVAKEEVMREASRFSHVLHQGREDNDRAAEAAGRSSSQRRSSASRRSRSASGSRSRGSRAAGSREAGSEAAQQKMSAALVAAHSPNFSSRLTAAFALTEPRMRGEGTVEERLADAEEEVAVLRQELLREREHGFREMRELRVGWEDAETRATALERQVVYLRCSEEVQPAPARPRPAPGDACN